MVHKQADKPFSLLEKFNNVEHIHWWWRGRRYLLQLLLQNKNPKKFLDVGCGTGETCVFLQEMFPDSICYGVDISKSAISYAKERGIKNVSLSEAEHLPYKDNYFDVVLLLDVLEHIQDDKKALLEAKRVLKKNGIVIVTCPALPIIWTNHDKNQNHFRRYISSDLRLFEDPTFTVQFLTYFNFLLSPIIISIRLLSKIKLFAFLANYDNGINYEVANVSAINWILTKIFTFEIWLTKFGIRYPFGISLCALYEKN